MSAPASTLAEDSESVSAFYRKLLLLFPKEINRPNDFVIRIRLNQLLPNIEQTSLGIFLRLENGGSRNVQITGCIGTILPGFLATFFGEGSEFSLFDDALAHTGVTTTA